MFEIPSLIGKSILITGGTGSLGKTLIRRFLESEHLCIKKIRVFSRDEAKQYIMRTTTFSNTDKIDYIVGDIRNQDSVKEALEGIDVVINTAALKQVPACEEFPYEAVQTNIIGAHNIVSCIRKYDLPIETVVGVSTDKACAPVNAMGMTKALQERIFINANRNSKTRFICVRYGNVLASRGSVIPLFHSQILAGGPITITDRNMTRFLLSLDDAVNLIFRAIEQGARGDTYIPIIPSAKVSDIADVLREEYGEKTGNGIQVIETGIRPGEKVHECLISPEERYRSIKQGQDYVIKSLNSQLRLMGLQISDYSSADGNLDKASLRDLLLVNGLLSFDGKLNTI